MSRPASNQRAPLKLAVIGDPVAHSASPELHRAFLAAAGLNGTYEAIRVCAGDGTRAIDRLRALGYTGLNVTTPLKEEALACADRCDSAAAASGAANTLLLGPHIEAYNTDGIGALTALTQAGIQRIARSRVLVLGAGPAARAVIGALTSAAAVVCVWNRTVEHAQHVAGDCDVTLWHAGMRCDAVVAALPPSAAVTDPALLATVHHSPIVIDVNYGRRATLAAMLERSDVRDGRTMLEAGARAAFAIFSGSARPMHLGTAARPSKSSR